MATVTKSGFDYTFKFLSFNKAQPTARIIKINGTFPVYFFISQQGNISVYNTDLNLVRTHSCYPKLKEDNKPCIYGVVHMEDCQKLVTTSSHQMLHFYDISATIFLEEYEIYNLPASPICLAYRPQPYEDENISATLAMGTECGSVFLFHFSAPTNALFKKQGQYKVEKIPFEDLVRSETHLHLVRVQVINLIHSSSIYQIQLHETQARLISCSRGDCNTSLAITDMSAKLKTYKCSVETGISCFDASKVSSTIVTGSPDTKIRVWNIFAMRRPLSIMEGHVNSVITVQFIRNENEIASFSRDGVVFLWSAETWTCMYQVFVPFPAFFILGHKPKFSLFPLFVDGNRILITCSQWFVQVMLKKKILSENKLSSSEIDLSELLASSSLSEVAKTPNKFPQLLVRHEKSKTPELDSVNEYEKHRMKRFVEDGGPHWALKMHRLEELDLSEMPVWQKMNEKMALKKRQENGGRLAGRMMKFKVSLAFRKNK